ncbi:MAG: hypothetical protein KDC43_06975 [Saprospiraceae bacterium]|nr:hypothetical protein [Saprospiraceae bacterium]MCB0623652.1 hypothetical protein [Saprospiraceae bacterium]
MQGVKLTDQEVAELMIQYESEIRKLRFLIDQKKQAIAELKAIETVSVPVARPAAATSTKAATTKPKGRRGRPAKKKKTETAQNGQVAESKSAEVQAETSPAKKKRVGRPRKATATASTKTKAKATAKPKPKAKPATKSSSKTATKSDSTGGYRLSDWDTMILDGLASRQKVMISADLLELGKKKVANENLGLDEKQIQGKINRSLQKLANKRGVLSKTDYPGKGHAYGLAEWADPSGEIRKKYQH